MIKTIYENDEIKITNLNEDWDIIATIENKTSKELTICFDDENLENITIEANNHIGLLAINQGRKALKELKRKRFLIKENNDE